MTDFDEPEQTAVNDSRTGVAFDTPVTHESSRTVLENVHRDFPKDTSGLENARRYFIAQRDLDGAKTKLGHRWSNLVELMQTIYGSTDPVQRDYCIRGFARNLTEIIDLRLGRERRRLSPSQLRLAYSTNQFH